MTLSPTELVAKYKDSMLDVREMTEKVLEEVDPAFPVYEVAKRYVEYETLIFEILTDLGAEF